MDFGIYAGDTSKTIYVWLADSTTGLASTGQVWNVGSPIFSYNLPLAARSPITPATQTVTGAWSSGGFVEVDGTNEKGVYRLDLPDAAIASGAFTIITLQFTGVKTCAVMIPLHTRKANVTQLLGTAWLTPGVPGTPDVNAKFLGAAAVTATTSVTIPAASTLATTAGAVGSVTGAVASVTGSVGSVTTVSSGAITAASFGASAIDAAALAPDAGTEIGAAVISALGSGTEVFGHSYLVAMKRIEVASGNSTLSGAGSGTEVLTSEDSSLVATYTVDASGNILAIGWV